MNPLSLAALGGALWWLSRLNRNPAGAGFRDKRGNFHPIRSSEWYQPSLLDQPEPKASPERQAPQPVPTLVRAIDPEYPGEIVRLELKVRDEPLSDLQTWKPWTGDTAKKVASISRLGANNVRPGSATKGGARSLEGIIHRDGRYQWVDETHGGPNIERDLGTDRGKAVAYLGERLAMLTGKEPGVRAPVSEPDWLDGEERPRRPLETRMVKNGGIPQRPPNDLKTTYAIVNAKGAFGAIQRVTTSETRPAENSRQDILYVDNGGSGRMSVGYDPRGKHPMPEVATFGDRGDAGRWLTSLKHDLNALSRNNSASDVEERRMILGHIAGLVPHPRARPMVVAKPPSASALRAETNAERQRESARERAAEYKRLADVIADPAKAQGIDVGDMVLATYTANYKGYEVKGVITKRLKSAWKVRPIVERQYRSGAPSAKGDYKPYPGAGELTLPGTTDKGWTRNNGITGKTFITPAATVTRYSSPKEVLTR